MNNAFSHFGNVIPPGEVISMYIDVLSHAISFLVQRFHDAHEGCTHMDMVSQDKSEGDVFRAQGAQIPK